MVEGHETTGTLTFLFTDVEGSTRLWEEHPGAMAAALARHDAIVREVIDRHGGVVFSTAGDAFAAAFATAGAAAAAALDAQRRLEREPWPRGCVLKARMGLHSGTAVERDGDYFGPTLNRTARIAGAAHGGQVLMSEATRALLSDAETVDLGAHRLKDLRRPERLWQLGSGSFPAVRSVDIVPNNLPSLRTDLVGREQVLDALTDAVQSSRLVSLVGLGGVGKTTLALAVAGRLAPRFSDGVFFVDLVPLAGIDPIAGAVAAVAGVSLSPEGRPESELAGLLARRSMLLVLDNCEHVIDDVAEMVDALLSLDGQLRLLVTSREPLDVRGERVVPVEPLDCSGVASPAARLLEERARAAGARISDADLPRLVAVCERLDGLALAIELAAPNLRHLTPDQLVARLDHRFELLRRRARGRHAERHSSLGTVLAHTWESLPAVTARFLERLAVFPSRFDLEAACTVGSGFPAPEALLRDLVARALVTVETGAAGPQFRLLESVKLFARDRWGDDAAGHRAAHLDTVLGLLPTDDLQTALTSWQHWRVLDGRWDDVVAAVEHAHVSARDEDAATIIRTCSYYARGARPAVAREIARWCDHHLAVFGERADVVLTRALAHLALREMPDMARRAARAVVLAQAGGQTELLVMSTVVASWTVGVRDPARAVEMLEAAAALAHDEGLSALGAAARSNVTTFLCLLDRNAEAADLADEILANNERGDYAANHSTVMLLAATLIDAPARARAALGAYEHLASKRPMPQTTHVQMLHALVAASEADVPATRQALLDWQTDARRRLDDDGLPDLLLPVALLAFRLGEPKRAAQLLGVVRRHPRPTQGFPFLIVYRRLVATVGLAEPDEPPEDALAEALRWMDALIHTTT